jgi:hypothetical protein
MRFLLLGLTLAFQTAAPAAPDITEPAHASLALTAEGRGFQVYTCSRQGVAWQWTLKAPEAELFSPSGEKLGTHSAGPTWTATDGSSVTGKVLQKKASTDPTSIPWLLLAATPAADHPGALAKIAFVRRSETHGGQPPANGCDATHSAATTRIPYKATYTFYTAATQ